MEDPKDPRTWKIDYFPNVPKDRGDPPTEPISLQRQIDTIKNDFQKAVDALNNRIDDAMDHSGLYGVIHALRKRVDSLEADRAAWTGDAVKAGAHLKFQKLETRINEAFRRIGLLNGLEKKIDACWAGQEEVTRRVANYTKALEMAVEAGDVLLEKKIDACRVALNNVEQTTYEHTLRLHGLDNLVKDHPVDPWKKRWDSLKAYVDDKKHEAAGRTVIWDALARVLQEMDEIEKS